MKKVFIMFFLMTLGILATNTAAWGGVYPNNGDTVFITYPPSNSFLLTNGRWTTNYRMYASINPWADRWFTVDKKTSAKFEANAIFGKDSLNTYSAEYYENDQTFVGLNNLTQSGITLTNLRGSYLFDFGMFAGIDYWTDQDGDYIAYVAPGYRFNLGDQGYISASVNYSMAKNGSKNNKITSYEINGVYYPEKAKVYGEIAIPNQDVYPAGDTMFLAGANFKVEDNLVCGLSYSGYTSDMYFFMGGLTYSADKFIINALIGSLHDIKDNTIYAAGGSYRFTEGFTAGIEYQRLSSRDQGRFSGKLDFTIENGTLEIGLIPENTAIYHEQIITALYKINL